MGEYRQSRNIEISTKDYITAVVNASWSNVRVLRSFSDVKDDNLPAICIRLGNPTSHNTNEVGSTSTIRTSTLLIDIFSTDDGNRLDLKDFLIEKLKGEWDYKKYTITNKVSSNIVDGKIKRITITDTEVSPSQDKSQLAKVDRYRHLITLTVTTGKVEV